VFFVVPLAASIAYLAARGNRRRQVPSRRTDLDPDAFREHLVENIVRDGAGQNPAPSAELAKSHDPRLQKNAIYICVLALVFLTLIIGMLGIATNSWIEDAGVKRIAILGMSFGVALLLVITGVLVVTGARMALKQPATVPTPSPPKEFTEDRLRALPPSSSEQTAKTPRPGVPKGLIYGGLFGLMLLVLIVAVLAIAATQSITDPSVAKTAILSIVIGLVVCVLIIGVVVIAVAGILWGDKYVDRSQPSAASDLAKDPAQTPVPASAPLASPRQCPVCGEMIPDDSPEGLCPKCILGRCLNAPESPVLSHKALDTSSYDGPSLALPPGELATRFPGLEILELLGLGGMGAVYKARQTKLDRLVAVKVLPPEWGKEPAFAERFAREAKALARLGHPHIVAVHDFGESDGLFYLVMEYVDGANLRNILQAGRLEPAEALAIIPQICDALQYAHGEGIVHRDIKPENILLDSKGRVKIADFGLAKLLGRSRASFTLTGTHQVMGTLDYMAPEQRNNPQEVDHRADIYSLGVVFYEMLTGELPLGRFAPPSHSAGVDARLDKVVFKALEREPQQRYQRVSEVKTDLEAIAAARFPGPSSENAVGQRTAETTSATVSFKLHTKWGRKYSGVAHLEADALVLEYEAGLFLTEWKVNRIEIKDIRSLELKRGGLRGLFARGTIEPVLSLRVFRPISLDGIPGRKAGRLDLYVPRYDAEAAQRLASALNPGVLVGPSRRSQEEDDLDAIGLVRWPSRVLMLLALLAGMTAVLVWSLALKALAGDTAELIWQFRGSEDIAKLTAFAVAQTAVAGIVFLGARRMRRLQNYSFVRFTVILAMMPLSCGSPLAIPLGIWILLVMSAPAVRAAFLGGNAYEHPQPSPRPTGPVRHRLRGFIGSMYSLVVGSRVEHQAQRAQLTTPPVHSTPTGEPGDEEAIPTALPAGRRTSARLERRTDREPVFTVRMKRYLFWGGLVAGCLALCIIVSVIVGHENSLARQAELEQEAKSKWEKRYSSEPHGVLREQYEDLVTTLGLRNYLDEPVGIVFRNAESEYLTLEERFTKRERDKDGRLKVTMLPFKDEVEQLEERFWAKLESILTREDWKKQAREQLPRKGRLFPFGKERARIEIWQEDGWYHGKVFRGEVGPNVNAAEEFDGPRLPAMYERFWAQ
jgi:hypothetical protein